MYMSSGIKFLRSPENAHRKANKNSNGKKNQILKVARHMTK